jgi:hypothetical protein
MFFVIAPAIIEVVLILVKVQTLIVRPKVTVVCNPPPYALFNNEQVKLTL